MLKIRNITFIAALVLLCNGLIAQKAKRKTVPQKKKTEVTATTSMDKVPVAKELPNNELKWFGFEEGYKKTTATQKKNFEEQVQESLDLDKNERTSISESSLLIKLPSSTIRLPLPFKRIKAILLSLPAISRN